MPRATRRGLTIRAALILGFGTTLGLWLFASYSFSQRIGEVQRDSAAIHRRYMEAQELLSTVRTQVLMGSVYVRDALLDPNAESVDVYREHVEDAYDAIDVALQQYVPILDSSIERTRVNGLRQEIDGFRSDLLNVLATDRATWRTRARPLLGQLMPRRTLVMQVSNDLQTLNRSAFLQQQQAVAEIYAATVRRVWASLGLALIASLGIALFATVYVGRLEADLQQQRAAQLQTTDELQRLSTELVRVQEEERRTIARELHDEVGQVLTAIKVELAVAQRRLEAAGHPAALLDDAQTITDGALHTVRDLSHLLHPALLDDLGLTAALESYVSGFGKRHSLAVELLTDGMAPRLASDIEASVYRIVQEALTNVVKHAQATFVLVYVRRTGDRLEVSIEDDGVGFEPAKARRGLGLIGIRERVAHLGGTTHLSRGASNRGTRLTIEILARPRASTSGAGDGELSVPAHQVTRPEVLLG